MGEALDWYLDSSDPAAVTALRREITGYVRRHAEPGSDLGAVALAVDELAGNVHKHASGPAWVELDWREEQPLLRVHDLGPGFALGDVGSPVEHPSEGGRGLFLVSSLVGPLRVAAKDAGGTKVTVVLPARRRRGDLAPPRAAAESLPGPEEADEEGAFAREPFLRALVVQLAQGLEREHGPSAAEASIAQVGADVGGRMEDEYRRARGIVEHLTPEQIADLYVRLKHAIDGDFYVVEANEERIVLRNRRCPFGEAVQRAPALCRMTSSVFGGIAARNRGGAVVDLDERIAVGDTECQVTVWLGPHAEERRAARARGPQH